MQCKGKTDPMENETPAIACTLTSGALKARVAEIAALNKDALLHHARGDLELVLVYRVEALERVREMVRRERECCAFLSFDLRADADEVRLTIRAPEAARDAAELVFAGFARQTSGCCC